MTQPPVQFENYPPDDSATPDDLDGEHTPDGQHAPVIRPYVPEQLPPDPASSGSSRRTAIGLVVGVPLAAIILGAVAARPNPDYGPYEDIPTAEASEADPDDPDAEDPASYDQEFSVDGYTATAPAGWTVDGDGKHTVEVTRGANRLTAVGIETATSTLAVDEIAHLAKRHRTGFTGKIGDPVDRSSVDVQHATMDGAGKFKGKAARLLVELWIDDDGSGLLVSRVLTAKAASAISTQAQEMLDELSGDF